MKEIINRSCRPARGSRPCGHKCGSCTDCTCGGEARSGMEKRDYVISGVVEEGPEDPEFFGLGGVNEGTEPVEGAGMGSVKWNIEFGRFPEFPGVSAGMLSLHASYIRPFLVSSAAFVYNHVMQRRIVVEERIGKDRIRVGVETPMGRVRFIEFDLFSSEEEGASSSFAHPLAEEWESGFRYGTALRPVNEAGEETRSLDFTAYEEVLADGACVYYDRMTGDVTKLKLSNGVTMSREQWEDELKIVRYPVSHPGGRQGEEEQGVMRSARDIYRRRRGVLHQVWSRTDGLLDFVPVKGGYEIRHFLPEDVVGYNREAERYELLASAEPVRKWSVKPGNRVRNDNRSKDGLVYKCPDHLDSFTVVEQAGDEVFSCKWMQPSPEQMIFVRGTGPEAEIVFKTRTDMDGRGRVYDRPVVFGISGRSMGIAGVPCGNLLETRYYYKGEDCLVNGMVVGEPCYSEQYLYQAFDFGPAVTEVRVGLYLDKPLVTRYVYGTTGGGKGQCILKTEPSGEVTGYNYDEKGRLVSVKGSWGGGGSLIIRYSYHDSRFNDRRPYARTVLVSRGEEIILSRETHAYESTAAEYRKTTIRSGLGVDIPLTSVEVVSRDAAHPFALGRMAYCRNEKGVETWYDYAAIDPAENREGLPLMFKCTEETRIEGRIVANKSVKTVSYFDDQGNARIVRRYVHTGVDYSGVSEELRTYDYRSRLSGIKSEKGEKTTRWGCYGPLEEVDEDSMKTLYEYDSAGNKARIRRPGMKHTFRFENHDIPQVALPASVTELFYDGKKNLIKRRMMKGLCESVTEKSYDDAGRLVVEQNAMGQKTLYSRDGLMEKVVLPGGSTLVTRYHADGHVLELSGTGRRAQFYTYDLAGDGIRTRISLDMSGKTRISESVSDGLGRLLREQEPGGPGEWVNTGYAYNSQGLPVRMETLGHPPLVMTYDRFGDKTSEALLLGRREIPDQSLDRVRRLTRYYVLDSVSALGLYNIPMLRSTDTQYSAEGLSLTVMREETLSPEYSSIRGALLERVAITTDRRDNDTLTWVENHQGNRVSVMLSPESSCEERTLTVDGEVVCVQRRNGTYMDYCVEYTPSGKKVTGTDGRGNTQSTTFNLLGAELTYTDGAGNTVVKEYDSVTGNLESVTRTDGSRVLFMYDVRGRKSEERQPDGRRIKYEYDEDDHLIVREEMSKEGVPADEGQGREVWIYDSVSGVVLQEPGPNGICWEYGYDAYGRLASMRMSGTESCVSYEYASLTGELLSVIGLDGKPEVVFTYNHLGQMSSVEDRAGKRSFRYSIVGEVEREVTEGELNCLLDYARDRYGRVTGCTLTVDGEVVRTETLSYDEAGRLSMTSVNGQPALIYEYRDDNGLPESMTYPSGLQRRVEYGEKCDLVSNISYYRPRGTLASRLMAERDKSGRVTKLVCDRMGEKSRTLACAYDDSGNPVFECSEEEGDREHDLKGQAAAESGVQERIERTCDCMGRCVQQTVYEGEGVRERRRYVYEGLLPVAELDVMRTGNGVNRIYQWDRLSVDQPCLVRMTERAGDWEESYEYTHFWNNAVSEVWNSGGELVSSCDYGFEDDSSLPDRCLGYPFPFPLKGIGHHIALNMISVLPGGGKVEI